MSADAIKVDRLVQELGASLPDDAKHSLLRYVYMTDRDQVSVKKISELLNQSDVDINFVVNGNSALLVALNRFLDKAIVTQLMQKGANGNMRTAEGRLLYEVLMDDLTEVDQIKETIKCFKRAMNPEVKLSAESKAFANSKQFKDLIRAHNKSSITLSQYWERQAEESRDNK